MTDPRRTLVVRWLAAGDAGDLDAFDALSIRMLSCMRLGLSTTAVEDERSVWREGLAAMPGIRHEVQEVVVEGDVEMACVLVSGTMVSEFGGLPGTGRAFRIDQAVITHLRDGRITEAWEITDIAALQAQTAEPRR